MKSKPASNKEITLKEYPNVTYWLEERRVMGWGNLILTTERLIFLNRIHMNEWQSKEAQQISLEGDFDKIVDFTMKLHKKNFQIPILSVTGVRMGFYTFFPFPKLCLRVQYLTPKGNPREASFWFRIPLIKGLVELEPGLVFGWIHAIKSAIKKKQKIY